MILDNAYVSKMIGYGTIPANGEKTINVRIWVDESGTIENASNKYLNSKVIIHAGQVPNDLKYTVISNAINGTISTNTQQAVLNGTATYNLIPTPGYVLDTVTCTSGTPYYNKENNTLVVSNVIDNGTCNITFKESYEISVIANNGVSMPTSKNIGLNDYDTFEVLPNTGYEYSSVTCTSGTPDYSNGTLTVSNVTGSGTCTVNFTPKSYNATINITNGSTTESRKNIAYNSTGTFTVTPNENYQYGSNTCGGSYNSETNTFTTPTITGTLSCNIVFTFKDFVVTNIILNGSFEKGTTSWTESQYLTTDNTTQTSGLNSLKNTGTGATQQGIIWYLGTTNSTTTSISVTPGNKYYFQFYQKNTATLDISNHLVLKDNHNVGALVQSSGVANWQMKSNVTTAGTTGSTYLAMAWVSGASSGTIWTDSVILADISTPFGLTMEPSKEFFDEVIIYGDNNVVYKGVRNYYVGVESINGTVSTTASVSGSTATYIVTPDIGYEFNKLTNCTGGNYNTSDNTLTISNVASNIKCQVEFKIKTYSVTASSTNGTISGTNPISVNHGSSGTFTVTPNTNYTYSSASCTSGTTSYNTSNNILTVSNITGSGTCTVNFVLKSYALNINVTNGTSSPTSRVISHGGTGTYTVTPTSGYTYSGVTCTTGSATYNTSTKILTVTNVTAIGSCTVTFLLGFGGNKVLATWSFNSIPVTETPLTNSAFASNVTTQVGVYPAPDDYGTSYYVRGASNYNYMKFGKDASGNDYWWRIIRINGDNTIRMIYQGMSFNSDSGIIDGGMFYQGYSGTATSNYQGYMRSRDNLITNSDIKTQIDNWYSLNLLTNYSQFLADRIFCGDLTCNTDNCGNSINSQIFGALSRINSGSPSFICPDERDQYTTLNANHGNKALTYPIALITADEVFFAGATNNSNNTSYYLSLDNGNYAKRFWTMSPAEYEGTYYSAKMFVAGSYIREGIIYDINTPSNSYLQVRPVINISANVPIKGNGTTTTPFELDI